MLFLRISLSAFVLFTWSPAPGAVRPAPPQPVNLADLAANRWTPLPGGPVNGYAQPIYHAAAKTLVAPLFRGNGTAHLDPKTGAWGEALSPTKGSRGGDCPLMKRYALGSDGRPNYANMCLFHMVTYDSKRGRVVAGAAGFFAAYDPKAKTWTDLKSKVELFGREYPGAPPVAWGAMCYDPVNDEIVMLSGGAVFNFDHWADDQEVTGAFGTFIYDCRKNVWHRPQGGPPEFYKAREMLRPVRIKLQDLMGRMGEVVVLEREGKKWHKEQMAAVTGAASLGGDVREVALGLRGLEDSPRLKSAVAKLAQASEKLVSASVYATLRAPETDYGILFDAHKFLVSARDEDLWSHPHPRSLSRMVYLPDQKAILLWGGTDGHQHLNDTWLYDCTKREWQKKSPKTLPRPREMHVLVYDAKLRKAVMAGGYTSYWAYPKDELREVWTYDAEKDDWSLVLKDFPFHRGQPSYFGAYDPDHDVMVIVGRGTWALRLKPGIALDAPKTDAFPKPEDQKPFLPPKDEPKVLRRWKSLPANTWVSADPNWEPGERGWGMMGWNGRLGCAIHWGGGHSTYQANDICLYFPGANKWVRAYPAHRINIAPWNKGCGNPGGVDLRGGPHNLHARNGLAGNGGKILITMQTFSPYWYGPDAFLRQPVRWGKSTTFEFDLFSRRWRLPCPRTIPGGMCYPYNARNTVMSVTSSGAWYYDFEQDNWVAASVKKCPANVHTGEGAGRLYIEKKSLAVMVGPVKGKGMQTWALDVARGEWTQFAKTSSPPGRPTALAFVDQGDGYIFAGCFRGFDKKFRGRGGAEAVYSFKHDRWALLDSEVRKRVIKRGQRWRPGSIGGFHSAWSKVAYSPRHNLLIDYSTGTWVMRPDLSRIAWEEGK